MTDKKPDDDDLPKRVIAEFKEISKDGIDHPRAKPALYGAGLGVLAGLVLIGGGFGFIVGALVGALAGIYYDMKK